MAAGVLVSIPRGVVGSSVVLAFPGNCFFNVISFWNAQVHDVVLK